MSCVHQIQMSLSLPFTNVTGVGRRAGVEPRRSAAPTGDRLTGVLKPHQFFYNVSVAGVKRR